MWDVGVRGVKGEWERERKQSVQQLVFMREGLKLKGWESSKTWLSCAICHSGTLLPLDPALCHHPAATTPDDLPQHLCDTNFAQENKVIHRELLWGEWHFMSTLCTYWSSDRLSDKQTGSQPSLACPGIAGKLGTVLIMQICRANWFGRQAQLCQQSRKQNAAYAQFQQNPPQMYANITRIRHVNNIHNQNLSPTRTLGENWKGIP